jgi:hypothetical protein
MNSSFELTPSAEKNTIPKNMEGSNEFEILL